MYDYITVKEAAAKWNLVERSIQNYCVAGKIPGAETIGWQWFIPADAQPPLDGRTKTAKRKNQSQTYRFPVFLYSRYYAHPAVLTEDEQCLLQAQTLRLEGEHLKCIHLCKQLLEKNPPASLAAGIYLTLGCSSIPLGLAIEYREALSKLEQMTAAEQTHQEDFRLMIAALRIWGEWNCACIREVIPSRLSPEAVPYYEMMVLNASMLSTDTISYVYLRSVEAECLTLEREGLLPVLYVFLGFLGTAKDLDRTQEEKEHFLRRAFDLAVSHNWVVNLMRLYNFSPAAMDRLLREHKELPIGKLHREIRQIARNWNIIHAAQTGYELPMTISAKQIELLLLVSYGYTNRDIALCTNSTESSVKNGIKRLMEITGTQDKAHLRAHAKKYFDSSFAAAEQN